MFRSCVAALAVVTLFATNSFAGDCGCGQAGPILHSWHQHGYQRDCGDACSDPCGGGSCKQSACGGCGSCRHCCFPLIRGTLHVVGKVVGSLIPHPCRRSGCCGTVDSCGGCDTCDNGCSGGSNWNPSGESDMYYNSPSPAPTPAANPFQDDAAPSKQAMHYRKSSAPTVKPKAVLRTTPSKSVAAAVNPAIKLPTAKKPTMLADNSDADARPLTAVRAFTRSVLKVSHQDEEACETPTPAVKEVVAEVDERDLPPAAPASIRFAQRETESRATVTRSTNGFSTNPLRR